MTLGKLQLWIIAILKSMFGMNPGTGGSGGSITTTGPIYNGDGTIAAPSYSFASDHLTGISLPFVSQLVISVTSTAAIRYLASQVQMPGTIPLGWNSAADFSGANDTYLSRGAAGIVCVGTTSTVGDATGTVCAANFNRKTAAAASLGNIGGCAFDHFANGSSTSTDGTLDTLYTDTTVANTLLTNGDKIQADYLISIVSSATATRRILISFAGITIFDSGALTYAATGTVRIYVTIIRVTSTTCRAVVDFEPAGSATVLGFRSVTYTSDATLTALTLSGTNVLVVKGAAAGTGAASADIVGRLGTIFLTPAGS